MAMVMVILEGGSGQWVGSEGFGIFRFSRQGWGVTAMGMGSIWVLAESGARPKGFFFFTSGMVVGLRKGIGKG